MLLTRSDAKIMGLLSLQCIGVEIRVIDSDRIKDEKSIVK